MNTTGKAAALLLLASTAAPACDRTWVRDIDAVSSAMSVSAIRLFDQLFHRPGQCIGISKWHQDPGLTALDYFRNPPHPRRHARPLKAHQFQDTQAKALHL